jgi:hypothetical protein
MNCGFNAGNPAKKSNERTTTLEYRPSVHRLYISTKSAIAIALICRLCAAPAQKRRGEKIKIMKWYEK